MSASDPTETGRQRSAFRAVARQRVARFLALLKQTLVDQDMMGAYSPEPTIHPLAPEVSDLATRLKVLTNYVNQLAYNVIVEEGRWLRPVMDRAFVSGMQYGTRWAPMTYERVEPAYYQFARNELEGIADALVQQVSRVLHQSLMRDELPREAVARVRAIALRIEEQRLYALGHMLIVHQHNLGRIAQIKAAGSLRVGIVAERRHVPRRFGDALRPGEYEVLTAGDDDVCPECEEYAANGPYEHDDIDIPLHVNCRCAAVPVEDERFANTRAEREAAAAAEE
jgi:hypothetical protein